MFNMYKNNSQKGFTLIELLIVIVIIGILAAVLISVLNPVQQQNRARDASVRSSINKMALATKSLASGTTTGELPTPAEFVTGVSNVVTATETCSSAAPGVEDCTIEVNGINLPADCDGTFYMGGGETGNSTQCRFAFIRDVSGTTHKFKLGAATFAQPRGVYVYAYEQAIGASTSDEGFFFCAPTTTDYLAYGGAFDTVQDLRDATECTEQ